MHEHIGDDRGNRFGFQDILCWMMLAEQAMLAGSQPDSLQHLVLPIVSVIKRSPNAASSLQQSPIIKQVATSTTNARITRSSFISTETESTKSSGRCASPHSSCTDTKHHGANPSKLPNNSPKFISAHVRTNQQARERSNTAYPSPRGGRRLLRGRRLNDDLKRT